MLTTKNSSGVVEGPRRIEIGEIMTEKLVEIEAVRNFAMDGVHVAIGKTVRVNKRTANYLIGIGKAKKPETAMVSPAGRGATTAGDRPVGVIEGIGHKRAGAMAALDISTVAQLAGWSPTDLAGALDGVSEAVADGWITAAQEMLTG